MDAPRIRTLRVQDFAADTQVLAAYDDPHRHVAFCTPDWVRLLTTNPLAQPADLALVLAIDGNRIVGRLGFFAAEVSLAGQRYKTYVQQAFFLDEEYRPTGAGSMLLLPAISSLKCLTGMGNSAPETVALCQRLGFSMTTRLRRFVYFYRSAALVQRYVRQRQCARGLSVIADPLLRLANRYRSRRGGPRAGLTYRPVRQFDESIDRLLHEEQRPFFPRGAALLNWIMSYRSYDAFTIHDRERLLGYCLLQTFAREAVPHLHLPAMTIGRLADYYLPANALDAKRDLVRFAVEYFAARQVELLECQVHDAGLPEICQRQGLFEIGGMVAVFRPPRNTAPTNPQDWFLTFGTGDILLEPIMPST